MSVVASFEERMDLTEIAHLRGPIGERISLAAFDGSGVWVDRMSWVSPLSPEQLDVVRVVAHGACTGEIVGRVGVLREDNTWTTSLPWQGELLVKYLELGNRATGELELGNRASQPQPQPQSQHQSQSQPQHQPEWGEHILACLGRYLRRLHQPIDGLESLGSGNSAVVEAVWEAMNDTHELSAGALLGRQVRSNPTLVAALARAMAAQRRNDPVVTHGRCGTGNLVIPRRPVHPSVPLAVLIGWFDAGSGPAASDVGHLLADLAELAVIAQVSDRPEAVEGLARCAQEFRNAYQAASDTPLHKGFWQEAAAFGTIKVLEHQLRVAAAFGREAPLEPFISMAVACSDVRTVPGSFFVAPEQAKGN